MGNAASKNVDTATDNARHQQFASGFVEENRNGENRPAFISTPTVNPKVIEDANVSPVQLAKVYMERNHLKRENEVPSASSSPVMALTKKAPNSMAALDNSFITPRSRFRPTIHSMPPTPYSKPHLTSKLNLKGTGISSNGLAEPSFFSPTRSRGKSESRIMSIKRRNSVIHDEFGSVGPIRRLRPKPNLLASRTHHTTNGEGIMSHPKQKPLSIGEPSHKASKHVGENENESAPMSKSNQVASKILQQLEEISPREKSPLKSMEDVDTSKLPLDVQDGSNATLADVNNFSTQNQEQEVGPKKSVAPLDELNSVPNNDSVSYMKASTPSTSATDSVAKTGASQPPQKKRPFRMIVEEDYFEQDDDANCDGLAPGPTETTSPTNEVAPPKKPKLVKPSIQPAGESHLAPITHGIASNVVSSLASEETNAATQSAIFPMSVTALDKPRETYNTTLFSSSSALVEKVDSLPSAPLEKIASVPDEKVVSILANSSGSVPVTTTPTSLISGTSSTFGSSTPAFGSSALTSPSPSTGLVFGAPAASSSTPSVFSFTSASPSILSSPSAFGNPTRGFGAAASPDQMNAEDSMAEDNIVQTSVAAPPSFPVFGQQMAASSTPSVFGQQMAASSTPSVFGQQMAASSTPSTPSVFGFGSSSIASQPNPFMFGGQQNQAAAPQQRPSPFQASGILDQFNVGGSFLLGSGGGDKSGRKVVRINRNKNRKK